MKAASTFHRYSYRHGVTAGPPILILLGLLLISGVTKGGGRGGLLPLPPGVAGKGAQNSVVDATTKVRLMQFVE